MTSFYSFFYGGTYSTYLSLHFSVRARALSSLITRESPPFQPMAYDSHLYIRHRACLRGILGQQAMESA
jgi:hypothetical protein